MQLPDSFTDEMTEGDFSSFKHDHHFKATSNGTIMIDVIEFESPFGLLGKLVNRFYLQNYLQQLLEKRNQVIKEYAETNKWKAILTN